jgi:hypothetical protein
MALTALAVEYSIVLGNSATRLRELTSTDDVWLVFRVGCTASSIKKVRDFSLLPVTTKENHVTKYGIQDRCYGGRIPSRGVVIDESSGSSGNARTRIRNDHALVKKCTGRTKVKTTPRIDLSRVHAILDRSLTVWRSFVAAQKWTTTFSWVPVIIPDPLSRVNPWRPFRSRARS